MDSITTEKTESISYSELARRVGDCILNNELQSELAGEYEFELFNGEDQYCYVHENKEECAKDDSNCDYESTDVYQTYIITESGAEYLQSVSNEIVYHCEKLNIYLWGITHFGTSWTGVYTKIKSL
jgi:hypothetical protein